MGAKSGTETTLLIGGEAMSAAHGWQAVGVDAVALLGLVKGEWRGSLVVSNILTDGCLVIAAGPLGSLGSLGTQGLDGTTILSRNVREVVRQSGSDFCFSRDVDVVDFT